MLSWLAILNNEEVDFSLIDVLFGKFDIEEDFIVIKQIFLLAKLYIYRSNLDNSKPSTHIYKGGSITGGNPRRLAWLTDGDSPR